MAPTAQAEKKCWIPKVSKERIQELAARIKPVARFARGEQGFFQDFRGFQYYIEPVDLWSVAYTWDPKPTKKATGLKPLCVIMTYHTFGFQGCFKPSIAEVLAQIPEEHLDRVVAFEIVVRPESVHDLNKNIEATNAGCHVARTQLFVRK